MTISTERTHDIAIVGGGLAGLATALSLGRAGHRVALFDNAEGTSDPRTTAMLRPSVDMLREWGIWQGMEPDSAPLRVMRIVDGSRRLIRAPIVSFAAEEIGEDAFGWNVPNASAAAALRGAIEDTPAIETFRESVLAVDASDDMVELRAEGHVARAALVVGADGRGSLVRRSANIRAKEWDYPQAAVVTTFSHELPHGDVSTEFHTEHGPATQVPLPGRRSSLVWVTTPREAEALAALPARELGERVEQRLAHIVGRVEVDGPVGRFPMRTLAAASYVGRRTALVGEAAHAFPPIGAQGFNLTMRDVAGLTALVRDAEDPGDRAQLEAYETLRRSDAALRTFAVDAANRALLSDGLAVQTAKALGLEAVRSLPRLRNAVMREGFEPTALRRRSGSDLLSGALRRLREAEQRFRVARG